MAKETGYKLIQGRENQVRFDASCPKCKSLAKEYAWIENNSFNEQIQCTVCRYEKNTAIRLAEDELSDAETNIKIKMNLWKMALPEYRNTCKNCSYIAAVTDSVTEDDMRLPTSCPKCGSKDMDFSFLDGNTAMLIWMGKNYLRMSDND